MKEGIIEYIKQRLIKGAKSWNKDIELNFKEPTDKEENSYVTVELDLDTGTNLPFIIIIRMVCNNNMLELRIDFRNYMHRGFLTGESAVEEMYTDYVNGYLTHHRHVSTWPIELPIKVTMHDALNYYIKLIQLSN